MPYTLETQHNASAYTPAVQVAATFGVSRPWPPVSDVAHHWGDPNAGYTHDGVIRQFANTPAGGSSAHYVLSAGRVTQMVNEADASHANGHAAANAQTVTWELNPRCSAADRETFAEALADVWIGRGMNTPGLIEKHKDYYNTACPGRWEAHLPAIQKRAGELFAAKRKGQTVPAPAKGLPAVLSDTPAYVHVLGKKHHHVIKPGHTLSKIAQHYGVSVATIQKWNKITDPDKIRAGDVIRVR